MKQVTILVVDDEATLRKLMQFHLQPHGFRVLTAANGREAVEVLARETPDLAIVDVMMPDMSGYDLTRHIRADARTAPMPVILLTALSNVKEKVEGFQAGADDFLVKPAELPELLARVQALLRRTAPATQTVQESRIFMLSSPSDLVQVADVSLNLAALAAGRQSTLVLELIPCFTNTASRLGLEPSTSLTQLIELKPDAIGKAQLEDCLIQHKPSGIRLLPAPHDGKAPGTLTQEHTRAILDAALKTNSLIFVITHAMVGPTLGPLLTSTSAALMVTRNRKPDLISAMVLAQQLQNRGLAPRLLALLIEYQQQEPGLGYANMETLVKELRLSAAGVLPALSGAGAAVGAAGKLAIQTAAEPIKEDYAAIVELLTAESLTWPLTPARLQASSGPSTFPALPPSLRASTPHRAESLPAGSE